MYQCISAMDTFVFLIELVLFFISKKTIAKLSHSAALEKRRLTNIILVEETLYVLIRLYQKCHFLH